MKKVAVVTGSSSGIGAASAILFAKNGWDVAINYSRSAEKAEAVADQCRALGSNVICVRANVADDADCRMFAKAVEEQWGGCDVLVNNAGTTKFVPLNDLEGLSGDDFHSIYAVNVVGAFQMVRAFTPMLRTRPGAGVVNVSSIAPLLGGGSSLAYIASKGALNSLSMTMARILGPEIRVNVVDPGMVDGDWLRDGLGADRFEAQRKGYESRAALHRIVSPQDVAETVFWLGAGAKQTTGEISLVDAGFRVQAL